MCCTFGRALNIAEKEQRYAMDRKLILERHNRVEKSLRQNGVDAVVLFNVEGIGWEDLYYFSGFRGHKRHFGLRSK